MTGLDPGIMYSVVIHLFDGNQVVLSDQTVTKTITVMSGTYVSYIHNDELVNEHVVLIIHIIHTYIHGILTDIYNTVHNLLSIYF